MESQALEALLKARRLQLLPGIAQASVAIAQGEARLARYPAQLVDVLKKKAGGGRAGPVERVGAGAVTGAVQGR